MVRKKKSDQELLQSSQQGLFEYHTTSFEIRKCLSRYLQGIRTVSRSINFYKRTITISETLGDKITSTQSRLVNPEQSTQAHTLVPHHSIPRHAHSDAPRPSTTSPSPSRTSTKGPLQKLPSHRLISTISIIMFPSYSYITHLLIRTSPIFHLRNHASVPLRRFITSMSIKGQCNCRAISVELKKVPAASNNMLLVPFPSSTNAYPPLSSELYSENCRQAGGGRMFLSIYYFPHA